MGADAKADARGLFGRVLVAMVTPFDATGQLDLDGAQQLATHLVDRDGVDGLAVSGTTGEAPTTSDEEKQRLLRAVVEAVGNRAVVLAGVGTNDTAHSAHLAREAQAAGADGLLVVTPYYSRPPQSGLLAHFRTVADAADLPVMLYDIPARTGTPIAPDTLARLAEHPRIVAVKDAKGDLGEMSATMARTDLAYYSGDDTLNLPMLAVGAIGVVSVTGHLVASRLRDMLDAYAKGDPVQALSLHRGMLPVCTGLFRTQGVILTKAALALQGLPAGPVRPPLVDATEDQITTLTADLLEGGVLR